MTDHIHDVAIIGAGIVGLATALALIERKPDLEIVMLEKECQVAQHQTGHNSGVIHSGIYYKPGSLKARLCLEGRDLLWTYCESRGIPARRPGKLIVATEPRELPRLNALYERGLEHGIPGLELIDQARIREIEPHVYALSAILVPTTGVVDYRLVAEALASDLEARGVSISKSAEVIGIQSDKTAIQVLTSATAVRTRYLINCAGLHSDRIARLAGEQPTLRIVPFRGEYYSLRPERRELVNGLVYPVPDPDLPFLGVHLTREIDDEVKLGPNAVLAFAREGYTPGRIRPSDLLETLTYQGFLRLARRYWRTGIYEMYRSLSRNEFLRSAQQMLPELTDRDLVPGGAGVRAQAITLDGKLVDDFAISESPNALHVLNAPSPAATASLAIGRYIAERALPRFDSGSR